MKRGKSMTALSVFGRFKSPANDDCVVDAQGTRASTTHRAIRSIENVAARAEPPNSSKSPLSILKLLVNRIRGATIRPRSSTAETRYTEALTTAAQERPQTALRERGWLPYLRRNKGLSRREQEQDRYLSTFPSPDDAQPLTPADQIKKEWEAKKRIWEEEERERLNSFRFGTQSTSVNEAQPHGQPSPPEATLATDEDAHSPSLGDSGAPMPRSPATDHSLTPTTPLSAPVHACSVAPLPPQTSVSIQASFQSECPVMTLTPSPLPSVLFQEDARRQWNDSSVSGSHTSLATPSVDAPLTTMGFPFRSSATSFRLSGVKDHDISTIPESPIEDDLPPENGDMEIQEVPSYIGQYHKSKRRKRRAVSSEEPSGRRLAISTSLNNMRRSVANTLMRTGSGIIHKGLNRDSGFSHRLPGVRSLDELAPRRQAVAPTLHTQGSILLQTSAIEDEEARRLAELAYLG